MFLEESNGESVISADQIPYTYLGKTSNFRKKYTVRFDLILAVHITGYSRKNGFNSFYITNSKHFD